MTDDFDLAGIRLEVMAEGLTRNLPAFARFLEVAACCNGDILNYSNISNDAQVPHSTVTAYFQVLVDTLLGFELPVWRQTVKRKPIRTPKFFFFDTGVLRYLQKCGPIREKSPLFGMYFESWMHHELRSYVDYHPGGTLHFWRSEDKAEVDFILSGKTAIEAKGKRNVGAMDLKGLAALREEQL